MYVFGQYVCLAILPSWLNSPTSSVFAKGKGHWRSQESTSAESEQEPSVINLYVTIIQPKFRVHFVIDYFNKPFSPH